MAYPLMPKASNNSLMALHDSYRTKGPSLEQDASSLELPTNFDQVVKGVYRSAFLQPKHFPALETLGLKAIITLVDGAYTPAHERFLEENGITHYRISVQAHKDPTIRNSDETINRILELLLDPANHPILVHCNKGKHRTGCVVACFRKAQQWCMSDVVAEYRKYSYPKNRDLDERFMYDFDISTAARMAEQSGATSWEPSDLSKPELRGPSSTFNTSGLY